MPTRQREYLTLRSFRAPHLGHDASWGSSSAPQETQRRGSMLVGAPHLEQYALPDGTSTPQLTQRRGSTLVGAPHLEQYALWDGSSAPQDGQRIHSVSFSAGYSVDMCGHYTISAIRSRTPRNYTDGTRGKPEAVSSPLGDPEHVVPQIVSVALDRDVHRAAR